MPRIPLYNQGAGATTRLATGQLSPRASTEAFTAPGRAYAGFQQTFSDVAKVAADFELAQQKIDADTLETQLTSKLSEEMSELENQEIDDVKTYETEASKIFNNLSSTIDNAPRINSRLKSTLKNNFNARFSSASIGGKQNAFTRKVNNQATSGADGLKAIAKQIRIGATDKEAGLSDALKIFENLEASGADKLIDFTFEDFTADVEREDFATKLGDINDISVIQEEFDNATKDKGFSFSQKSEYQKIRNQRISTIQSEAFDIAERAVQTSNIPSSEIEDIIENGYETQIIVYDGKVIADLRQVDSSQYQGLFEQLRNRSDDVLGESITNQSVLLNATDDVLTQMELNSTSDLGLSKEEENNGNLNFLSNRIATISASLEINPNSISVSEVNNVLAETITILNSSIGGQASYLTSGGDVETKATKILTDIGTLRESVRKSVTDSVNVESLAQAFSNGNALLAGEGVSEKVKTKAQAMALEGKTLPEQIQLLNINDSEKVQFTQTFNQGFVSGDSPIGEDNVEKTKEALALFQAMKNEGGLVLGNHIKNADVRAYYEAVLDLNEFYTIEKAIDFARNAPDLNSVNIPNLNREIDNQIEVIKDRQKSKEIYALLPFIGPEFVPANVSEIQRDIAKYAKTLAKYGIEPESAIKKAAEFYNDNHMRIGNLSVRKLRGMPDQKTMNQIRQIVVEKVITENPNIADEFDAEDLSIRHQAGNPNEFLLVNNGNYPVTDKNGSMMRFSLGVPYAENTLIVDGGGPIKGVALAGTFPPDSLFGMLQTEQQNEIIRNNNIALQKRKLEVDFKLRINDFEGLNQIEARKLRGEKLQSIDATVLGDIDKAVKETAQELLPTALEFFRKTFTLENNILEFMSKNTPSEVIIDLAIKGGKAAKDFADKAEINAAKFRKQQGIE